MATTARTAAALVGSALLLAGPTVLAFFTGGYFDAARVWAGLIAWALVFLGMVTVPSAVPRDRTAWLALGGLGLLAAWTLLSMAWAPIVGSAYGAGQRLVLYAGTLLAAACLLQLRAAQRAAEPALAVGAVIVIGYGLSERLLPGLLHFSHSNGALGRLEQPLTYWNAMGELAALGLVLCSRLAGDVRRPLRLRVLAAAASAPLGMGLYLSVSRGALFACLAGLVAVVVAAGRREQLWAALVCAGAGLLGAFAAAPFRDVTSLLGPLGSREQQGAVCLALLTVAAVVAGFAQRRIADHERPRALGLPRHAPLIALVVIVLGLGVAIIAGAKEHASGRLSSGSNRLVSLQSNRYAYWRVAVRAFGDEPLRGVGAGGWAVYWLRYRPFDEGAQNAHSLPIETAAELGLVGVVLLLTFVSGVGLAARKSWRRSPAAAAGPLAGCVVYLAHSPLDWDWQVPAVTLIALVLAGSLLAQTDGASEPATREGRRPSVSTDEGGVALG